MWKDIIFFFVFFPFGFIFPLAGPAIGVFRPLTTFLGLEARLSRGLAIGLPWNKKRDKKLEIWNSIIDAPIR